MKALGFTTFVHINRLKCGLVLVGCIIALVLAAPTVISPIVINLSMIDGVKASTSNDIRALKRAQDKLRKIKTNLEPDEQLLRLQATLAHLGGDQTGAARMWLRLIEVNPNHEVANLSVAQFYETLGRWEAVQYYLRATANGWPDLFRARIPQIGDWLLQWGDVLYESGQLSKCEEVYGFSTTYLSPIESARASLGLARCLAGQEHWQSAVEQFQRARDNWLGIFPEEAYQQWLQAMIELYRQISLDKQEDARIQFTLARLLIMNNQTDQAIKLCIELKPRLRSSPAFSQSEKGLVAQILGTYYEQLGLIEESVDLYEEAIDNDAKLIDSYQGLLRLYRLQGQPEKERLTEQRLDQLQPEVLVNSAVVDDCVLEGFDYPDSWSIGLGTPFIIRLYWRSCPSLEVHSVRTAAFSIEERLVTNLIPNGGFESPSPDGSDEIAGFVRLPGENDSVVELAKSGDSHSETHTLQLALKAKSVVGVRTKPLPVSRGEVFLRGVRWRSVLSVVGEADQGARFQESWYSANPSSQPRETYLLDGGQSQPWLAIGKVVEATEDDTELVIYLMNWEIPGRVWFDDAFLILLVVPGASAS